MNNLQLNELHKRQVIILDEIVRLCNAGNIKYYLLGGTLLGAIRHKGFIPWDDDLDIGMPRADFEKFKKIALSGELNSDFFYQDYETDKGHTMICAKIRMNNTLFVEKSVANVNMHQGIYVDIFPLDSGDGKIRKNKNKIINRIYYHIQRRRRKNKRKIDYLLQIVPECIWIKLLNRLIKGKGEYYLNYGSQYGMVKQTISKSHYEPSSFAVFEGKQYSIPGDYEFILRRIYGDDYLVLPPEEKRITHNPIRLSFNSNGPDEIL